METPTARVRRLVLALEELFRQQNFLLDQGEPADAVAVQERCVPLVEDIACTMLQPGVACALDAETQTRAQRLIAEQLKQIEKIAVQKEAVRQELSLLNSAQVRTRQFRHAYAAGPGPTGAALSSAKA